jgi:hypothetical protein
MSPETQFAGIPADVMADLAEVCRQAASGGVRDPELLRRVQQRAEHAREKARQKIGVQDIGAGIIREMRDSR